ncbi:MAG: histidinol-phosphate transaminase [Verrucomicrobia bacterium]|nr:histidinol-phosphate transaminase [Verrucomicrobiota bacterium]
MTLNNIALPHVPGLAVYEPGRPIEEVARELGLRPEAVVKLASNENPLGPSPKAVAAMRRALKTVHLYPDGGGYYLRQALAKHLGVGMDNLALGNGSNEIIELLFHAFVAPGDEVVYSERSFAVYMLCAGLFRAKPVVVPMKGHTHDLDAMLAACNGRTKIVFVANPNNPTGTRVANDALCRFLDHVPQHTIVAIDEAYFEFLDDPPDTLRFITRKHAPNIILLRTFSKIVGLAGLRIGYGIAGKEMIALLNRVRQPFNVNAIAQAGALAALSDRAHIERTRKSNRQGLAYLEREFGRLRLEFIPSAANFICVRVGDGAKLFVALQKRGVIVRPMAGYAMPEWVRVTVGTMAENRRLVRELRMLQRFSETPASPNVAIS